MHLRRLLLTRFRCFARLDLALPAGPTVIVGSNAQGKSSLLEAAYVLATMRAAHATSERELIHWQPGPEGMRYARVACHLERAGEVTRLELIAMLQDGGGDAERLVKRVRVNDVPRRALDAMGLLNVVLFTPRDLDLIDGAPAQRRRYLDVLHCQIDPVYCRSLARYSRGLAQRNQLLRHLRARGGDRRQLDYWEEQLAGDGAAVLARRLATVDQLSRLATGIHAALAGDHAERAPLAVTYESSVCGTGAPGPAPAAVEEALAERLLASLRDRRGEDMARGATSVGPHRDDLRFVVGGVDMRVFGSRGQQRTVALAWKLAEARLMRQRTGEWPVLLLDDVLSELDPKRRGFLLDAVEPEQQTLLTTTEQAQVGERFLSQALLLTVENAAITAASRGGRPEPLPVT